MRFGRKRMWRNLYHDFRNAFEILGGMKVSIIEYDQESGILGIREMDDKFKAGWETLIPLKFYYCCRIYRTTLYHL